MLGDAGSAKAAVVNTYSGAECMSVFPEEADNLKRDHGVTASSATLVICPLVKNIFNSTAGVSAGAAASGGTSCRLESFDVFTNQFRNSGFQTIPGPTATISSVQLSISSSFRGALQLRCFLPGNGSIRNYGATEN